MLSRFAFVRGHTAALNEDMPGCRRGKGKAHKTSADAHRQALTGVLIKSLPGLLREHQTDEVKVGSSTPPCSRSPLVMPCISVHAPLISGCSACTAPVARFKLASPANRAVFRSTSDRSCVSIRRSSIL